MEAAVRDEARSYDGFLPVVHAAGLCNAGRTKAVDVRTAEGTACRRGSEGQKGP